jgi:transcription antitermination factor NusG
VSSLDSGPTRKGELEPVRGDNLEPVSRNDSARGVLEVGEEVLITGGIFEGQTGVVEGVLPSGRLRVTVETRRSPAAARVDPLHLERLGILVEGSEETS